MIKLCEPQVGDEELQAIQRVFGSGWLAEGKETAAFEQEIADCVGADYAVAVCNATVGLELCLRALEIEGRVAVPAFGHPATVRAILNAGCEPVFVDVSPETYNIDLKKPLDVEAYMPVSEFGNPEYVCFFDGSPVIEDAACTLIPKYGGGTRVFSFHPRKLITTGEGGIITTNDKSLADKLRSLKNFGYTNAKFDDIRAAIGREQLKKLPAIIKRRRELARVYGELLTFVDGVDFPVWTSDTEHVFQTYAIYLRRGNRDAIIDYLHSKGIETQRGAYYLPLLSPKSNHVDLLRNSVILAERLLALPMAASMTYEQQKQVITEIQKAM